MDNGREGWIAGSGIEWGQLVLALFFLFPFAFLLLLSVGKNWAFPHILPETFSLANWAALMRLESGLNESLAVSLLLSVSVATVATAAGFFCSRVIAYRRQAGAYLLLAYFPFVFAPVILAACLQFFFVYFNLSGKVEGVMLAQLLITFPFSVLFFFSFWNERFRAIEQLVNTLGGSTWQALRQAILPMSRGPLLVCFFQTFLISWFEYGLTMLLGVGKVQTLTVRVFQFVTEANIFLAAMAACMLFVPPLILLWVNKRYIFAGRQLRL